MNIAHSQAQDNAKKKKSSVCDLSALATVQSTLFSTKNHPSYRGRLFEDP